MNEEKTKGVDKKLCCKGFILKETSFPSKKSFFYKHTFHLETRLGYDLGKDIMSTEKPVL